MRIFFFFIAFLSVSAPLLAGNATAFLSNTTEIATDANFSFDVKLNQQAVPYPLTLTTTDTLTLNVTLQPDSQHRGQMAAIIALANYNGTWFYRRGKTWQLWQGSLDELISSAELRASLQTEVLSLFQDTLNVKGQLSFFMGYAIMMPQTIVFNLNDPVTLTIE